MDNWKDLTKKTVKTLQEDGMSAFRKKAVHYLKKRQQQKKEASDCQNCFRDVLFINGCDENLPHPGRYRVSHQREQLESLGITTGEVYYQNLRQEALRCYRVFLFFRCPWTEEIGKFVETALSLNKTLLYDVDDLVFDTVYTDKVAYLDTMSREERRQYDDNVKSMGRLLRLCHGAVTTTEGLAQELKKQVPHVFLNRNVASEEMLKLSETAWRARMENMHLGDGTQNAGVPVKIGYFSGSITHDDDFAMILPVLLELMEKYPGVQLHLAGELDLPQELHVLRERIVTYPFMDWKMLPAVISEMDINLAPLTDTVFNCAKSENKWMEAALVKVPTAASDLGAFHIMVENRKTGILCQNLDQWREGLELLIIQPQYRRKIGEAAYHVCTRQCTTATAGIGLAHFIEEMCKPSAAFLLPGFQVSGGVMVALQHSRILRQEGWDVTLFSIEEMGKEQWYEFEGCRFPVVNINFSEISGKLDWCVATMWSTCSWMDRIIGSRQKGYLVQAYEPSFYEPGNPLRMQARKTYGSHPDWTYLTISQWCLQWLWETFGHKARFAPNGLETDKFFKCQEKRTEKDKKKIRILIEGDCTEARKRIDESFHVVERLDPAQYEIWYMAYHGTPRDWYRVDRFLPEVPYEKVQEVYAQCDILLKSSVLESFSYPPLEMMATGGCVVAVLNEGNQEYLVAEENCLLYPEGDYEKGADAIRRLAQDETLKNKLRKNGKETAQSRDWKKIQSQILELYALQEEE